MQVIENVTLPQVFFKHFASKNQLPGLSISGTLAKNGLNIGLGLYFYHISPSKKLKNFLAELKLGVNYQKIINVKKGIVQAVVQKKREMEVFLYLTLLFLNR